MVRSVLTAVLLAAAAGCSASRLSPAETTRAAAVADHLGRTHEAVAL